VLGVLSGPANAKGGSALCTPDAAPGRGRGYGRCVTWLGRAASEADPTARYAVTAEPAEAAAMPGLNRAMTVPEPVLVNYFGALGTGRVSPRSAGNRSSRGAWPVVEPALGDFGVFGASASAG
jgi:hypothetical protein